MGQNDAALLQQIVERRDAGAFSEIVGRYQDFVFGTCFRVLHNSADAEDAAQECFLRLARNARTIETSLGGWLHRVATTHAIDVRRKRTSQRKQEQTYFRIKQASQNDASWEDIEPDFDEALDTLPEDLRYVIIEHFLRRRKQSEIAEEQGLSPATVSRRVDSGLTLLRGKLKEAGVIASLAVLSTALLEGTAQATPASLTVSLGKMAASGIGGGSVATTATGTSLSLVAKIAVAFMAIFAVGAGVVIVHQKPASEDSIPPPAPVEAAAFAPSLAERVMPADTFFLFEVPQVPELRRDLLTTDLGDILKEADVVEFFSSTADAVRRVLPAGDLEEFGDPFDLLRQFIDNLSGEAAIAVCLDRTRANVIFDLCIILELDNPSLILDWLEKLEGGAQQNALLSQREVAGQAVYRIGNLDLALTADKGALLCVFGPVSQVIDGMLQRYSKDTIEDDALALNENYQSIRAKLPLKSGALMYADVPRVLELFAYHLPRMVMVAPPFDHDNVSDELVGVMEGLNLGGFGPYGKHIYVADKYLRTKSTLLLRDTSRNLPAFLASLPKETPKRILDIIPADAMVAFAMTVDPPKMWNELKALIAELSTDRFAGLEHSLMSFNKRLGIDIEKDLMDSLGREIGVFVPDFNSPFPFNKTTGSFGNMLLFVEASDPEVLLRSVDRLWSTGNDMFWVRKSTYRGVEVRLVELIGGGRAGAIVAFYGLQPSYAIVDGVFVFGINPTAVKIWIRERLEGKPVFTSNALYKETLEKLPSGFSKISFEDTSSSLTTAVSSLGQMQDQLSAMPQPGSQQLFWLSLVMEYYSSVAAIPAEAAAKDVVPTLGMTRIGPNEISTSAQQSLGAEALHLSVVLRAVASTCEKYLGKD